MACWNVSPIVLSRSNLFLETSAGTYCNCNGQMARNHKQTIVLITNIKTLYNKKNINNSIKKRRTNRETLQSCTYPRTTKT